MPDLEAPNKGKPLASASARSTDSLGHGFPQRVAGYLAVLVVIAFGVTACTTQLDAAPLSWRTAMPCARRAAGSCAGCQQGRAAAQPVPPVLAHVLMMTAFHWNTAHLSFLTQARTAVDHVRVAQLGPCSAVKERMHWVRVASCVDSFLWQVHVSAKRHV